MDGDDTIVHDRLPTRFGLRNCWQWWQLQMMFNLRVCQIYHKFGVRADTRSVWDTEEVLLPSVSVTCLRVFQCLNQENFLTPFFSDLNVIYTSTLRGFRWLNACRRWYFPSAPCGHAHSFLESECDLTQKTGLATLGTSSALFMLIFLARATRCHLPSSKETCVWLHFLKISTTRSDISYIYRLNVLQQSAPKTGHCIVQWRARSGFEGLRMFPSFSSLPTAAGQKDKETFERPREGTKDASLSSPGFNWLRGVNPQLCQVAKSRATGDRLGFRVASESHCSEAP